MTRIFVGLSGGVDSGTSAALLQEQGYDVVGVFIKIWQPEFIECTWRKDRLDAIRVASALGIPFKEIDLSAEYKKEVIDSMVNQYARGITPNPDVLCNEKIKFGVFSKWAWAQGADLLATGHYAQVSHDGEWSHLHRGADPTKDQSYFLYRISQDDLKRTVFPISEYKKTEVRVLAQKFGLSVSTKPDSQGLCFVGDITMASFLSRFMDVVSGEVMDMNGAVIGTHDGAALYTIGQRHGFTLNTKTSTDTGHYIIAIDSAKNQITVSTNREDAAKKTVTLADVHWIAEQPSFPLEALVQTRYREVPVHATLSFENDSYACEFRDPHIVSPGQSLVVYQEDVCLGGGFITA